MVFWEIAIIDDTYVCDMSSKIDCFDIQTKKPINDCAAYQNDDVICFTFVFKFAAGFGSAGGLITLAILFTKMVSKWLIQK